MNRADFSVPEYIFTDNAFTHFLIQYTGDIVEAYKNIKDLYITVIDNKYAILSYKTDIYTELDSYDKIKSVIIENGSSLSYIVYFVGAELYTLEDFSVMDKQAEYTTIKELINERILGLKGKGVIVGIIDTGVDYLCDEFIDNEGKSRIKVIWDQGVKSNHQIRKVPYGRVYYEDEINKAIEAKSKGLDPYSIVESKDEIGHGTSTACVVGGRGKNKNYEGVAPECEFAVVKLVQAYTYKNALGADQPVYNNTAILTAMHFLAKYKSNREKPMVIIFPLGTSMGSHNGNSLLGAYIKTVLNNIGIALVTGAGHQGMANGHSSGKIEIVGQVEEVNLKVDENEKIIIVQIWVELPNIMTMSLVSPSGQETGYIPIKINSKLSNKFVLDGVEASISNSLPDEFTGNQLIRVAIKGMNQGTWKIRMKLLKGSNARFDMWLPQSGVKNEGTVFIPADSYGTLTIPGDVSEVVTVGAYNQYNRNILDYSGKGFKGEYKNTISVVAPGKNILTIGKEGREVMVNGTSVSAAYVAGISALIFQWAIVNKNYSKIYSPALITMLERGTDKRKGDFYPNPQWGYGIVDLYKIFEELI
ncbi:MAG: S8 family peptidase [Clostridium sp.]